MPYPSRLQTHRPPSWWPDLVRGAVAALILLLIALLRGKFDPRRDVVGLLQSFVAFTLLFRPDREKSTPGAKGYWYYLVLFVIIDGAISWAAMVLKGLLRIA